MNGRLMKSHLWPATSALEKNTELLLGTVLVLQIKCICKITRLLYWSDRSLHYPTSHRKCICGHVLMSQCYSSGSCEVTALHPGLVQMCVCDCVFVCLALQAVWDRHSHRGLGHYRDNYDLERLGHHVEAALHGKYLFVLHWTNAVALTVDISFVSSYFFISLVNDRCIYQN